MSLNDVRFVTAAGGLGRLPAEKDYVSAIFIELAATPSNWTGTLGKKYLSTAEAIADGIEFGSANFGLLHYFVKEFFRVAGASELWIIDASDTDFTAQKVSNLTGGDLRQAFWYAETNYAGIVAQVGTCQAFATAMAALDAPMVILTNVKDEASAVNGTLQVTLRAAASPEVSVLIAGDGSGSGLALATSLGINYIPAGGAVLGAISRAAVHENIAWVERFNLTQGEELQKVILSDGQEYGAIAAATLDTVNTNGYLFLRKHNGIAGSYLNDSHTATASTSDYAYIENNRTMHKAKRNVRTALLPTLNSPLTTNADGTLAPDTVKFFESLAKRPLERMQNAGELSNLSVLVDPNQNVLATSEVAVQLELQPRGVARTIKATIGFVAAIS
jgi:hypothetical protein